MHVVCGGCETEVDASMLIDEWLVLFQKPWDIIGFLLWVLIFPVYHFCYPWLMKIVPSKAAKVRLDLLRRSWIKGLLERRDILVAAQQLRNLTMVNTLLASSSLILMGVSANMLLRMPQLSVEIPHPATWETNPQALGTKILLLVVVFGVAFAYCMNSLRYLGHFNLVIGADPDLVREYEGDPVDYFADLVNRASNRYTLAVRCLYSSSPLFVWLFDSWLFIALTLFWGARFLLFQDFSQVRHRSPVLKPDQ